jgi:hypothetical protein
MPLNAPSNLPLARLGPGRFQLHGIYKPSKDFTVISITFS